MVIVVVGPTSVGKTKLSIEIAKKINGEIINADSMQFYRKLDIGTAKVTKKEMENIPHHLFDILDVDSDYSIFDYQIDCRKVINDILKRGKTPILVGGTGLYIKAALYDYNLNYEKENNDYDNLSTEELYNMLICLDKDIDIDKNNRRRLIRAINYYKENNTSINNNKTDKLLYDTLFIGLTCERSILYDRINRRVDKMFEVGLEQEVRYFYEKNVYSKPLINGIGYKELYKYFSGEISLDDAKELIKRNSRRYAKRQYTFFNNQMSIRWWNVNFSDFDKTVEDVLNYINK